MSISHMYLSLNANYTTTITRSQHPNETMGILHLLPHILAEYLGTELARKAVYPPIHVFCLSSRSSIQAISKHLQIETSAPYSSISFHLEVLPSLKFERRSNAAKERIRVRRKGIREIIIHSTIPNRHPSRPPPPPDFHSPPLPL